MWGAPQCGSKKEVQDCVDTAMEQTSHTVQRGEKETERQGTGCLDVN